MPETGHYSVCRSKIQTVKLPPHEEQAGIYEMANGDVRLSVRLSVCLSVCLLVSSYFRLSHEIRTQKRGFVENLAI